MIDNPQEAAKIAVTRSINGRDEAVNLGIIDLRNLSAQSETTRAKGLGHFNVDVLQDGADAFLAQGLISSALDMRRVVVTDLIPE